MVERSITRRTVLRHAGASGAVASMAAACSGRPHDKSNAWVDGVELAGLIRSGVVSAADATNAAIVRAEAINPQINAIVTPTFDFARAAAAGALSGPFAGVPTFVKDLEDVIGQPTRYGSRAFGEYTATKQTPYVDAIFASGLVSIGKSSTPEFGATATTEPLLHGPTRNPWNLNHSTGGSSGGAAALVASGVVPLAHASDGGGSIRIPASCCGLVGLKVSRGRTPVADFGDPPPLALSVHGAVTRTVRDTAAYFAAMERTDADAPLKPVGLVTGPSQARQRIAFHTDAPFGADVHPEVVDATRRAARICEALGHEVMEIRSPFNASFTEDFLLYWAAGVTGRVGAWEKANGRRAGYNDFEPLTFNLIQHYEANKGSFERAVARLIGFAAVYERAFENVDILLSPVLSTPPPPIGHLRTDLAWNVMEERVGDYVQFTQIENISGAPAISLPLSLSSDGLPIGSMFAAKIGEERTLMELAFELEQAAPWINRTPPVWAF